MAAEKNKLTSQMRKFAELYANGMSKTEAYIQAYKKDLTKIKRASCNRIAVQIADKPQVKAYVDELLEASRSDAILKRDEALLILSNIARAEVGAFLDENGSIDIDKVIRNGKQAIKSIHRTRTVSDNHETVSEKITLNGQREAIDSLAKLEDWNKEKGLELDTITLLFNTGDPAKKM